MAATMLRTPIGASFPRRAGKNSPRLPHQIRAKLPRRCGKYIIAGNE
jgi:hypothetical protein